MRVLICALNRTGMAYPLIGAGRALVRRGVDVAVLTEREFGRTLEGCELSVFSDDVCGEGTFVAARLADPAAIAKDVRHLERCVAEFVPDVILAHLLCHAPVVLRSELQIPVAVLGMAFYLWPGRGEGITRPARPAFDYRAQLVRDHVGLLSRARKAAGISPCTSSAASVNDLTADPDGITPAEAAGLLGDTFMLRSIEQLQDVTGLPPAVRLVGGCLWEPDFDREAAWQALAPHVANPERPILHVQLVGRTKGLHFWPVLLDAARDLPIQMFVTGGEPDDTACLPDNVVAYEGVAQSHVLVHARAAVTAGQSTAVLNALTHGLPLVVVPGGGETIVNSANIVARNCGMALAANELTPETLREAIVRVMTSSALETGLRQVQEGFGSIHGAEAISDCVQALART